MSTRFATRRIEKALLVSGSDIKNAYTVPVGWTAAAALGVDVSSPTSRVIGIDGSRGLRLLLQMKTGVGSNITTYTWRVLLFYPRFLNPVANQPGSEFLLIDADDTTAALKWDHAFATGGASKTVEKTIFTDKHMLGAPSLIIQVKGDAAGGVGDSCFADVIA